MRVHSVAKINKLKKLRKSGYSINELVKALNIPKTTVWHHISGLKLSPQVLRKIRSNQGGSKKRKEANLLKAKDMAVGILKSDNRELALIISMLYWAEGTKGDCEFINSDGRMLALYLHILRGVFGIKNKDIKPTMRIFSGMDEKECLRYWSSITKIPKKDFVIRLNDGGTKARTKHGMCRITVKKGQFMLKVFDALREGIYNEMLPS